MGDSDVFWGIHVGNAEGDKLFLEKGYIGIGWPEIGDLGKIPATREAFKERVAAAYPGETTGWNINSGSQLFRFVHEMAKGDFVAYRSKIDRQIHIGTVIGDYEHRPDLNQDYPDVRRVQWKGTYPLTQFSQGALYELGSALTLFQVKNYADEYRAAMTGEAKPQSTPEDASVAAVVGDIEQNARDFIYKQFAQHLKGYGLQSFVAHLLTRMGYRTIQSPVGTDEGIDIIAHKDELKLEPPIIKVQVKSTEGTVGGPDVRQLLGNLGSGEYGLVVTLGSYSKQARDAAKSRANLRLIDGDELINLVLTHYDELDPRYKALIPLKKVYVPEPVTEESEKWAEKKAAAAK